MSNYFQELHDQGIDEIELSFEECQKLFKEGKITHNQFSQILIDFLGVPEYMRIMKECLNESYFKGKNDVS